MSKRLTSLRIVFGFLPWIADGVLGPRIGPAPAAAVALALAALPVGFDLPRGRVKLLEGAAALWFAALLIASLGGWRMPEGLGFVVVLGALSAIAWGSLLIGRPFTEQYAREDWPEPLWTDPRFRSVNRLITGLWGAVFSLSLILLSGFPGAAWPFFVVVTLKVAAVLASIRLPKFLARRAIEKRIAEQNPLPWPLPDLSATTAPWDAAVVGAGIGGLSAAALLAKAGHRVLVCEAHDRPGGYCSQWTRTLGPRTLPKLGTKGSFVFDAGVHDISGLHEAGAIRALLRHLDVEDRITWLPMEHELILPTGRVSLGHGRDAVTAALSRLHPESAEGIAAFFAEMEKVFHDLYGEVANTNGIPRAPRDPDLMLDWPRRHPTAFRWIEQPFAQMLAHFVADPAARATLGFLTGYISDKGEGLTVGRMAPIIGMLLVGGHYPKGGSQKLADLLVEMIETHGGEVRLSTPVERILVEGGVAAGIRLRDGREERAAAVIGAGDAKAMLLDLVGAGHLPAAQVEALAEAEPACSGFMVTLAVDLLPEGPPLKHVREADGRGFAIMIPSLADPSIAPPGHAAVTLLELVPTAEAAGWDREDAVYAEAKRARGDTLIARAERAIPGLSGHIRYRQEGSPATFARYGLATAGAIYGLALGGPRPHRRTPVRNLFLCGAGTDLGAGVEAVAISGMLVAEDLGAFNGRRTATATLARAA